MMMMMMMMIIIIIIIIIRSGIVVYFNVNLKLLTKLINSAFVGE